MDRSHGYLTNDPPNPTGPRLGRAMGELDDIRLRLLALTEGALRSVDADLNLTYDALKAASTHIGDAMGDLQGALGIINHGPPPERPPSERFELYAPSGAVLGAYRVRRGALAHFRRLLMAGTIDEQHGLALRKITHDGHPWEIGGGRKLLEMSAGIDEREQPGERLA